MENPESNNGFFPVNLMLKERPCLVVGGGKVAGHKAKRLLEAGANVTVVSPQFGEEITTLNGSYNSVAFVERRFTDTDASGMFLVFAATSDLKTNHRILESARQHGALACSTDKSWKQGDFITPATIEKDELTVAISTGGRSCRRSRLVKENLNRHLEMVETASLLVMGTSHNYLSVDQREPFHLVGRKLETAGQMLMQVWGVHEFILLNTCNRIELIAIVSQDDSVDTVLQRIMGFDALGPEHFYLKRGFAAFEHTCILTAGLLSQTPGEKHIVSQIKEGLAYAQERGWGGSMMDDWTSSALHVSKHLRSETTPYLGEGEIEDMALNYIESACGPLDDKRLLVLGTGDVGKGLVERWIQKDPPHKCQWFYHRQQPELSSSMRDYVNLSSLNDLKDCLGEADIIVCATASAGHVLHQGHAPFFDQEKDLIIIDLAMPRNVAPELENPSPNIDVVDLDDLKHWYRRKIADMARVYEISKEIVDQHQEFYDKIIHSFQGRNAAK